MIAAIGAVVHATHQRTELVRFYREKLGLGDPDHTKGEDFFRIGELRLGIEGADPRLRGPMPRISLSFVVDDVDRQVSHMKSLGVAFDVEPHAAGGARVAVCRDPDGNFVTLVSGPRLASDRPAPAHAPKKAAKAKARARKKG